MQNQQQVNGDGVVTVGFIMPLCNAHEVKKLFKEWFAMIGAALPFSLWTMVITFTIQWSSF